MSSSPDESEYKRIKDFLMWSLGIVGTCITTLGAVVAILTYNDRQNMKNEFKETVSELKEEIKTLKQEASQSVKDVRESNDKEIQETKKEALNEVASIKFESEGLARSEVKRGIELALSKDNFDNQVTAIAKKHIEPKVKGMIEDGFKTVREQDAQKVIDNMLAGNIDYGFDYFLVNKNYQFTQVQEKQLQRYLMDDENSKNQREHLSRVFVFLNAPFMEEVLKKWAYDDDMGLLNNVRMYFMEKGTDFKYYEAATLTVIKRNPNHLLVYWGIFDYAYKNYPKYIVQVLDSKPIIDYLLSVTDPEEFKRTQNEIKKIVSKDLSEKEIESKYLFRVK